LFPPITQRFFEVHDKYAFVGVLRDKSKEIDAMVDKELSSRVKMARQAEKFFSVTSPLEFPTGEGGESDESCAYA
jgi:hypothetical protein